MFIGVILVKRRSAASNVRNSSPSAMAARVFFAAASIRSTASLQKTRVISTYCAAAVSPCAAAIFFVRRIADSIAYVSMMISATLIRISCCSESPIMYFCAAVPSVINATFFAF